MILEIGFFFNICGSNNGYLCLGFSVLYNFNNIVSGKWIFSKFKFKCVRG